MLSNVFLLWLTLYLQVYFAHNYKTQRRRRKWWFMATHLVSTVADTVAITGQDDMMDLYNRLGSLIIDDRDIDTCALAPYQALYSYAQGTWLMVVFEYVISPHRDKDHAIMIVHHGATLALIFLSWIAGHCRVGAVVMLLHDSSDILVMGLKLAASLYPRRKNLHAVVYVSCMIVWFYTRLYLFGAVMVGTTWYKVMNSIELKPETIEIVLLSLLSILVVAHCIWTVMLLKLPFRKSRDWKKSYEIVNQ